MITKIWLKKNWTGIVIFILFAGMIAGGVVIFNLQKKLDSEITKRYTINSKIRTMEEEIGLFREDWKTAGLLTVDYLESYDNDFNAFLEVHDDNVEIYNRNWDIQWEVNDELERQIDRIFDYLR